MPEMTKKLPVVMAVQRDRDARRDYSPHHAEAAWRVFWRREESDRRPEHVDDLLMGTLGDVADNVRLAGFRLHLPASFVAATGYGIWTEFASG